MTGLFVELTNAIGRLNGLKIEWVLKPIGARFRSHSFRKNRCFLRRHGNDAARGKALAYTNPLSMWTFDVLVRADDQRFPGDAVTIAQLNNPAYSTAYSEGDVLETIAKNEYPDVKYVALPPLGTPMDNIMNLLTRKTDFVVTAKVIFQGYEKKNPGKLRYLKVDPPLRVYGNVIAVGIDDLKLQQLLNAGVNELVNSGKYHEIMDKYNRDYPGAFLPVESAYRVK